MPLWSDLKGHFAEAMFGWKWGNLACDSCQRPGGLTGMQIGHTIVALNLPSRSMLRIVTALSWCPPPSSSSHPETVCVCEAEKWELGGQTEWLLFSRGFSHSVKGEGCRAGNDISFWVAQSDGAACPPHFLPVVTVQSPWHCSPPQFRSAACARCGSRCSIEWQLMWCARCQTYKSRKVYFQSLYSPFCTHFEVAFFFFFFYIAHK